SVLSYSWTQYLAVRGHFILAIARQNSLVETIKKYKTNTTEEGKHLPQSHSNIWKNLNTRVSVSYVVPLFRHARN
ncbi:MAG: hypothetical protein PWP04_1, partial [Candidatus Atribacteria bacterium]|nr:hypothetical protein [Candidatus Atribacteria bacterium]